MQLRSYENADFEALFTLDQQCFPPEIAYSRGELRYFLKHPRCFSMIADEGGSLAGFFIAETSRSKGEWVGHLITIDVAPAARRTGTGRALMSACEQRLLTCGCASLRLEVAVNNEAAVAFYTGQGFQQVGRIPGYYAAKTDAFCMSKPLG
jgi:[ribosomal protein S18]-alanine N-acetyltransferase